MLINLVRRAKQLRQSGTHFHITESFDYFLQNDLGLEDFRKNPSLLRLFLEMDDFDIWGAIKLWKNHPDYVLQNISQMFLTRNLFKINLRSEPFTEEEVLESKLKTRKKFEIPEEDMDFSFQVAK